MGIDIARKSLSDLFSPKKPAGIRRNSNPEAQVAESVDAADLKSVVRKDVRVQVPPWAPIKSPELKEFNLNLNRLDFYLKWESRFASLYDVESSINLED